MDGYCLRLLDLTRPNSDSPYNYYLICVHYDKFTNTFYIIWIYLEPTQIPTPLTT